MLLPPCIRRQRNAGCAFVTFSSWAAAEQAIDGVDGKFTLPGAQNPIAVKMADAKPADIQRVGGKRGLVAADLLLGGAAKRQFVGYGGGGGKQGGAAGMGGMQGMGGYGNMGNMMGMVRCCGAHSRRQQQQ